MRTVLALSCLFLASALAAAPENPYVANLVETARTDYAAGHLATALAKLDQHDQAKGPTGESLDLRGTIALEQGKFEVAARAFNQAHKTQPELFSPRIHLADLFLRAKKYPEAREIYLKLATETNILISNERLRYGLLITDLAAHDEAAAKAALANIKFPTETPAYYFAQAAWEFAHGDERSARKWLGTAHEIFEPSLIAWFARPLYDLGWIKDKPAPPVI